MWAVSSLCSQLLEHVHGCHVWAGSGLSSSCLCTSTASSTWAAACLCRRGYDLAAFVQHGAKQALGLELSPTAVRCIPFKHLSAVAGFPLHGGDSLSGVFGSMCLTVLIEQESTTGRGASSMPQLSVADCRGSSVYAEGAQRCAEALLHELIFLRVLHTA